MKTPAFIDVEGWAQWIRQYVDEAENHTERNIRLDLTETDCNEEKRRRIAAEQQRYNESLYGTVNIHCTPSTAINALLYYLGLEIFSFLWIDYNDLLKQWIRLYQRDTLHYIEAAAHQVTSPMAMIYSDIAYKNNPMFSRKMLEEMGFFYEVEKICAACHAQGLKVIFHSDGNIMDLIGDLVGAGIDGLNPIEKAAGMDLFGLPGTPHHALSGVVQHLGHEPGLLGGRTHQGHSVVGSGPCIVVPEVTHCRCSNRIHRKRLALGLQFGLRCP